MLSLPHLLIVMLIVLLLFGTGRLPRLMEDLGKGINSFKKGLHGEDGDKAPDHSNNTPKKSIEDKSEPKDD